MMRKRLFLLFLVGMVHLQAQTAFHGGLQMPVTYSDHMELQRETEWYALPDLPGMNRIGVSAPFTGISDEQLIVAGGCNFPDKPAAEGGTKQYYDEIWTLDLAHSSARWQKSGALPQTLAYGASVTTPDGIVWIGGNNNKNTSRNVWFVTWNRKEGKPELKPLPSLPEGMDNIAATYAEGIVYVAGGNKEGKAGNTFLSLLLNGTGEKRWVQLPDFPGQARVQPVLAAQQSAEGTCIYLSGGFQPVSGDQKGIVSTDLLVYHPGTKKWSTEGTLPVLADGSPRTLTGGNALSIGNHSILFAGGVNYSRFMEALNGSPDPGYLLHPVEWYRFNSELLLYNTLTKEWNRLGEYEQAARAGAGMLSADNRLFIIGGELKPGIRTPEVTVFHFMQ